MNSVSDDFFNRPHVFDKIVGFEDLGFCYILHVAGLRNNENEPFDGIRNLQVCKSDTVTYNGVIYDFDGIGKLLMSVENELLENTLETL